MGKFDDAAHAAALAEKDREIEKRTDIVRDCQAILASCVAPEGMGAEEALNRLLDILDGPRGLEVAPPITSSML
jgi:hypothetical protein